MFTSEAVPFAKTGGLADVSGALPIELASRGHRCTVIMPAYRHIYRAGIDIRPTDIGYAVQMSGRTVAARLLKAEVSASDSADCAVDFYFVDQPHYFDRQGIYNELSGDYRDNCERFSFFCAAAAQAVECLGLQVDVAHVHDWPTSLIPAYIATNYGGHQWYRHAASVVTIHNLAYQGRFHSSDFHWTGMDWRHFNWHQMEYHGDLNLLKTGLVFSDRLTTVSNTYAAEIQTAENGFGLDGVLRQRADRLTGIVNGVDYRIWSPATDKFLPQTYSVDNWSAGKAAVKRELCEEFGLPYHPEIPLIGLVGRLADQKGWDLVIPLMHKWVHHYPAQWVILGTGDARYHDSLGYLASQAGHRLGLKLEFSDRLAHRIEAAADIFLMPSRFEPCGLNQLYSLKYGTPPVVHAVGGLVDTVTHASFDNIRDGKATGFVFNHYSVEALENCLHEACEVFRHHPETWAKIVNTGMQQDWSWQRSAIEYEKVYTAALNDRRNKTS